jgi:hypothetical protein
MTIDVLHTIVNAIPGICGIFFTMASLLQCRTLKTKSALLQLLGFGVFTISELLITVSVVPMPRAENPVLAQYAFILSILASTGLLCASLAFLRQSRNNRGQTTIKS